MVAAGGQSVVRGHCPERAGRRCRSVDRHHFRIERNDSGGSGRDHDHDSVDHGYGPLDHDHLSTGDGGRNHPDHRSGVLNHIDGARPHNYVAHIDDRRSDRSGRQPRDHLQSGVGCCSHPGIIG